MLAINALKLVIYKKELQLAIHEDYIGRSIMLCKLPLIDRGLIDIFLYRVIVWSSDPYFSYFSSDCRVAVLILHDDKVILLNFCVQILLFIFYVYFSFCRPTNNK